MAILVAGGNAEDARVVGNTVGATLGHDPLDGSGYGIRVDGAPDAEVVGNFVVHDGLAGIAATGSLHAYTADDGGIVLAHPDVSFDDPVPVTGGGATIAGNTVLGHDEVVGETASGWGVISWAGGDEVTVHDNTIGGQDKGIELRGGNGHQVTRNRLGAAVPDTADQSEGIRLAGVTDTAVGGPDAGNTVAATRFGIVVTGGETTGLQIVGNGVSLANEGIIVALLASGVVIDQNDVRGNDDGIVLVGPGATVSGNTITENERGIVSAGKDVTIAGNRIGLDTGGAVLGNSIVGVLVDGGTASVEDNTIAGSTTHGVQTASGVARLRGNRIFDSGDLPIDAPGAREAPVLVAAVRQTTGTSTRTTLVLDDLPGLADGTLEVFADDSCDADGGQEARYVLDITRTTKANEDARIIQIVGLASRKYFTVTYTDPELGTSPLSACVEARTYPDSDSDGSPDPIDGLLGLDADPSQAIIATDSEELLTLTAVSADLPEVEGGDPPPVVPLALSQVAIIDDPDPGAHPSGFTLPYGVLRFRVQLTKPGGRASVTLSTMLANQLPPGATYWKYGPPTTGASSQWYDFSYDDASGVGATAEVMDTPVGPNRSFVLMFEDGARGDADGASNATVTDPGGPVLGAPSAVLGPPEPAPADGGGDLPRTGSDLARPLELAVLLLVIGAVLVARGRRRASPSGPGAIVDARG